MDKYISQKKSGFPVNFQKLETTDSVIYKTRLYRITIYLLTYPLKGKLHQGLHAIVSYSFLSKSNPWKKHYYPYKVLMASGCDAFGWTESSDSRSGTSNYHEKALLESWKSISKMLPPPPSRLQKPEMVGPQKKKKKKTPPPPKKLNLGMGAGGGNCGHRSPHKSE